MSDPKSISSAMSLPQWMRSRIEKPDIDGIPFSPPSHDEFFYIRYPSQNLDNNENKSGIKNLNEMIRKEPPQQKPHAVDFSKHTEPCKLFINEAITAPIDGVKNPPKSFGTDDGFKGPSAACGSSIVKVAQLMVSGRSLSSRGFTLANLEKSDFEADNPLHTKTIEDQQSSDPIPTPDDFEVLQASRNRLAQRRGSKSLPASPFGSPKSMRKYQPNPYFTGSFALSAANNTEGRGWLLSSLLGIQREAISTTSVNEEAEDAYCKANNNNNNNINNSSSNTANKTKDTQDPSQKPLKAKPSELREMNFWSPTSM